MGLLFLALCRLRGANPDAGMAACAFCRINAVGDKGLAHASRALFVFDMGLIFMAEILKRGEHRIRG